MLQSKSIGVTVNMSGALRALRNSFTGHSNVIVELAQNARRAGASKVTILYDAEAGSLEVSDDGCGVGDMAVLLDVFRSDWGASRPDWSAEDLERESPYGMGMLAALYAAEHITVESAGARFEGDTSDLLNFIPVQVEPFPCTGTRVRLAGIKRLGGLAQLFTGFPIPVELNGVELPRPDAPNEAFKVCPVGTIRVAPLCLGWVAYLQGFRIAGSGRDRCNVIHLDGALFKGNAPDRRVLVDATESRKRIEEAVYAEQIEVVKEMKTAASWRSWWRPSMCWLSSSSPTF